MNDKLAAIIKGEVQADKHTLETYSHDTSLFEVKPRVVVFPKDSDDVCRLVQFVASHKAEQPELSLTGRSGGTDMSGGAINDSVIVAFERHFKHMGAIEGDQVWVQPGVYYRDFERVTLQKGLIFPSYPASRGICMMGGIVANNSGGEKSLTYGKTSRYVMAVKMVLRDGKEHTFTALSGEALYKKLKEPGLEGDITREVYALLTKNQKRIAATKPKVSKNSTGYNLWDAWDDTWDGQTLDLTRLIVGSQGTLGLITETRLRLVPAKPLSGMLVVFLPRLDNLGELINLILPHMPSTFESFDKSTFLFAARFFFSFRKTLGWRRFIVLAFSFIPVLGRLLRHGTNLPKIVLLIEFEGDDQAKIAKKLARLEAQLNAIGLESMRAKDKKREEKFWTIRRESFNLLRKNVRHKHAAPFIDDLVVPPARLPEFLPRLTEILNRHELLYTIAGHMGDGNFHVIPLMDLGDPKEREKIPKVLGEVINLVLEYEGSLSGEHNDGLIRGPFLSQMYAPDMMEILGRVKSIFDPDNIFNPHKKTTADWEYSKAHIRTKF